MLLQLQERGCAEQLVFEQCQAAAKKAIADLRMLCGCESTKCGAIGFWKKTIKIMGGSSWFLLSPFFLVILKGSDLLF